jgi:broad specificity phosphatase PhoE
VSETHLLLVRHPETHANVAGRLIGRGDSPYTHEGSRQLLRATRKIERFAPEAIWCSPLQRARRLAVNAGRRTGVEVVVDPRLVELDFGRAEGLSFDEIAEAGLTFNYQSRDEPVAPEGESRAEIEERTAAFFDEIAPSGQRQVIVTHGGVVRAGLVHLLGLKSTDIWAFHIHNVQLAHVRVFDGRGVLEEYVQA